MIDNYTCNCSVIIESYSVGLSPPLGGVPAVTPVISKKERGKRVTTERKPLIACAVCGEWASELYSYGGPSAGYCATHAQQGPCPACDRSQWWLRTSVGPAAWVCGVCHPQPERKVRP